MSREMLAVVLGLGFSLWALVAGQWGALALAPPRRSHALVLPVGALVLVALPPFWDFATSGLETGLQFGWLATIFWGLARVIRGRADGDTRPLPRWLPVAAGLGVLIRPDLGLFCVAYIGVMVWLERSSGTRSIVRTILLAIAVPVCFEVFRMGYYASLVPNTALAKSATGSDWSQGWRYVIDFGSPYRLWLPVAICLILIVLLWRSHGLDAEGAPLFVTIVLSTAALYVLYVVHLGGDFMHARFLLAPTFAALLPVAAVRASLPSLLCGLAVLGWAIPCTVAFRTPYSYFNGGGFISNEANWWKHVARRAHPVSLADYAESMVSPGSWSLGMLGHEARAAQSDSRGLLVGYGRLYDKDPPFVLGSWVRSQAVYIVFNIGVIGYEAGADVGIDDGGLADPVGSRLNIAHRDRPGHEKALAPEWIVARFATSSSWHDKPGLHLPDIRAASAALSCGQLHELMTAVSAPLTPARFTSNMFESFGLTRASIPPLPMAAQQKFCG